MYNVEVEILNPFDELSNAVLHLLFRLIGEEIGSGLMGLYRWDCLF